MTPQKQPVNLHTTAGFNGWEAFMSMSPKRKRLIGIIAVVVVAIAAFGWWQWSRWTGVDRLALDTPEASAFLEDLKGEQGVQKASINYGLSDVDLPSIEVEISVSGLDSAAVEALADKVSALMNDAAFQASFAERYNSRYAGSSTERPDNVQVVIEDTATSDYTFYRFSLDAPDYEPVLVGSSN